MKEAIEAKCLHQPIAEKANRSYSRGSLCSVESTGRM